MISFFKTYYKILPDYVFSSLKSKELVANIGIGNRQNISGNHQNQIINLFVQPSVEQGVNQKPENRIPHTGD